MSPILINALVGASLAVTISLISKSKIYVIAGLLPLFPTFALFAHIRSFEAGGAAQVREVAAFGLLSLMPYAGYLSTLIFTIDGYGFRWAVASAIMVWIVLACGCFAVWDAYLSPDAIRGRP